MEKYCIISDSSCDFTPEFAREQGVTVVPFYVSFDGVNYKKEGQEFGIRDFYQEMVDRKGEYPKTSLPSVQDYADAFLPFVQEGTGVVCICISSKFSGSVQSAMNAKEMILEEYPQARIAVIDAQVNTVLQGLLVQEAAKLCREQVPFDACVERIEAIRESGRIFFTVGSIDYLQHGGRIGKLAGTAASVLGIKPLITLKEGEIFSSGVARGRKKSLEKIIEMTKAYMKERSVTKEAYRLCMGFGYDCEEARELRSVLVRELADYGLTEEEIPLVQIGAAIAVHTGPYAVGIGIIKRA
ncbi:MAG: DegV family protein [Lachnospiraceae bacterium]|nr:DegV family protein [Lachnospiraceae bacterium]